MKISTKMLLMEVSANFLIRAGVCYNFIWSSCARKALAIDIGEFCDDQSNNINEIFEFEFQ